MAKKKNNYYAVKKGKNTGIYTNWQECEDQVRGFSGAEYKGFATEEDALAYLRGNLSLGESSTEGEGLNVTSEIAEQLIAYVDGSFDPILAKYSFGCVIITPNGEEFEEIGNGDHPESLALRNVAGEMLGAMYVVKWCEQNNYHSINIYYDYLGIEKWATGEWKANKELTKKYALYMKDMQQKIKISFTKVEAHSGNYYNDKADELAKKALTDGNGIPKVKKGDYWLSVDKITLEDIEVIIDFLKEEFRELNIQIKDINHGKIYKLQEKNKDKVVINYYFKNKKAVIQGKPKQLFVSVVFYVTEFIDVEDIPRVYNETYKLDIKKEDINSEFKYYMPNSYDKLPTKLDRTLHQAVYNLKLGGDVFDATFLAQPAIRAIEGHLKLILKEYQIILNDLYIKSNGFDMFEKFEAKYKLSVDRRGIANQEDIQYIEHCYTFYHNHRHQLSHWDDPTAPLDTTKLLTVHEARNLIKRTLAIIDEYYA